MTGLAGFDAAFIDMEHTAYDLHDVQLAVLAAERIGITPIVRTPGFDPAFILRLLDMGVQGIQVPHVSGAETAREAVKAVRYPPLGERGMAAGSRAADYGRVPLVEHMAQSNRETGNPLRPGIVHRLDKETSGIVLVAKNDFAHARLSEGFRQRTIQKTYIALVEGVLKEGRGRIELAISRDPNRRTRMTAKRTNLLPNARAARTDWRALARIDSTTLLEVQLHTGRTVYRGRRIPRRASAQRPITIPVSAHSGSWSAGG